MNPDDKLKDGRKPSKLNVKDMGFDPFLNRPTENKSDYIAGVDFDARLDEMMFNRMIKLKDLRQTPQGNEPGKIYWDGANQKFKLWHSKTAKWVDIQYTSTSTSSTSSSSSSTSTTSTSTSTT